MMPEAATVVHNDFKLDDLVWDPDDLTRLRAVPDWEMATVGTLDLACTLSFWPEPGVPSRRDVPPLAFLPCFGWFRRAAIERQKYVRFRRGDIRVLHEMCERAIVGEVAG